jgi:hypothetical protein
MNTYDFRILDHYNPLDKHNKHGVLYRQHFLYKHLHSYMNLPNKIPKFL